MRSAVFVLGNLLFAVLLLMACMVSDSTGGVNEIAVPTVVLAKVAASHTPTLLVASVTPAPTNTIFLSPTQTATKSATPTATWVSSYDAYAALITPTPALSADGQWQVITIEGVRFEIPSDWNSYGDGWYTNFVPFDGPGPLPVELFEAGLVGAQYYEDRYETYGNYDLNKSESLRVAGYPAHQWVQRSEAGNQWNFTLLVEGPDTLYAVYVFVLLHPDLSEAQTESFYNNGHRIFNHVIETFEIIE